MMSTIYTGMEGSYPTDPFTAWCNFSLPAAPPITGWGLSMLMDVNNIDNCTLPAGHVAADPHLTMLDSNGNSLANLEWRVTDNSDPTKVSNALLFNGLPVIPTSYGTRPGGDGIPTLAGYDPAIAGYGDHSGVSFDLVLAAGADGHAVARLNSAGPCGTVVAPPPASGPCAPPTNLVFNCGNGCTPAGGGNFQIFSQPGGTMNLSYTYAQALDDAYQVTPNTPLSVATPGVMANDYNPDSAATLARSWRPRRPTARWC